jgi:hypothetical protein
MSRLDDWRVAYAKQARADLRSREKLLEDAKLPHCQQLHFLQMACEKLCKAHLCGQGNDPSTLQSSHVFIAGTLPIIVRQQFTRESRGNSSGRTWVMRAIRGLARKVELLAPSVKDGGRQPANCEYPWAGPGGKVYVPCDYNFELNLLYEEAGRHFLKALYAAADELVRAAPDSPTSD